MNTQSSDRKISKSFKNLKIKYCSFCDNLLNQNGDCRICSKKKK